MPGGLQGWVNIWTKVNNKHSVFLDGKNQAEDNRGKDVQETSTNTEAPRSPGRRKSELRGGDTATTATATTWDDPEARAIRRFNSRKNRRRLQRTRSHSDLVREMAMTKEKDEPEGSATASKQKEGDKREAASKPKLSKSEDSNSMRWAIGLFDLPGDANMTILSADPNRSTKSVTTGKYLNETAFVQQHQQQSRSSSITERARIRPGDNSMNPKESVSRGESFGSTTDSEKARKLTPTGVSNAANHAGGDYVSLSKPVPRPGRNARQQASTTGSTCSSCEDLTARLYAVQADLEYLRSVSLRGEYQCSTCENQSRKKKLGRVGSGTGPSALSEASQRLQDVSGRHKRQIESMTRERSRWQQDIHSKLSKSSMMCNHWSKEAAIREEEETNLESELIMAQADRNALSSEVQTFRADLDEQQKTQTENNGLYESLAQYEEHGLDVAEDAVRKRDVIISELSLRLERTLDTLEIERHQQRQRRQIIFPGRDSSFNVLEDTMKLNEELEKAKDDARSAQEMLESVRAEAAAKEKQLLRKCEQLEKLLREKDSPS